MPNISPHPCKRPGCRELIVSGGYCQAHATAQRKVDDARRGTSAQRGYGYRWQQASKGFLRKHPLCQCPDCREGEIRLLPSQVVDHRIPHRGDKTLFWDRDNWQAMNKRCHDRKTALEDGGFTGAPGGAKNF